MKQEHKSLMEYVIPEQLKVQFRTILTICKRDCKDNWNVEEMLNSLVTGAIEHGRHNSEGEAIALLKRVRYGHFDSPLELENDIDNILSNKNK